MKRDTFKSEQDMAERVVSYLHNLNWDVYQEVQIASYGAIADIVAIQNNVIWIIECKKTFSMDLISQGYNWIEFNLANYVSLAVPCSGQKRKSEILTNKILEYLGIGLLRVSPYDSSWSNPINESFPPKLHRKINKKTLLAHIHEEQKTWAKAGNNKGDRYTPFKDTTNQVINIVTHNEGITLKELMNQIKHHYLKDSTAKSCIIGYIRSNIIKGIEAKKDGKQWRLYTKNDI